MKRQAPHHPRVEIKDGCVYSFKYDDIYYSRDDGPAESEYVFLEGNDLPARWQGKQHYCITETGFGTGLNFLVTLQAWLKDTSHCETLEYFAIEAYPLHDRQLREIHSHWPEFKILSAILIEQYPLIGRGCHTLTFEGGRVQLHLIFGSLTHCLDTYHFAPDAWYLDGFAPSRNPSMWKKEALDKIAGFSRPGTTLATFTAAGKVRRDLTTAGFNITKRAGFGRKREMLCGIKITPGVERNQLEHAPWFSLPDVHRVPEKIAVVGAGIAGAQTAWHLAQQGIEVVVIDKLAEIAGAASGNAAGILAPWLSSSTSLEEDFYLTAFLYLLRQLGVLEQQGHNIAFEQHGLVQLAHKPSAQTLINSLALRKDLPRDLAEIVSPQYLSRKTGESLSEPGLLMKLAGSLSPKSLCKALLSHPNIELRLSTSLKAITNRKEGPVLTLDNDQSLCVDAVVLANGHQLPQFSNSLPIVPVRGQTSSARLSSGQALHHSLRCGAYALKIPANKNRLLIGASYIRGDAGTDLRDEETQECFNILAQSLPLLAGSLADIKPDHAGVRATTVDRWPVVGPVADMEFFEKQYADLQQGKQYKPYPAARYRQGLYVFSGLGSRGITSSAFCANLLAHMILGKSPPAPIRTVQALHPARLYIRNLRKGRPMTESIAENSE